MAEYREKRLSLSQLLILILPMLFVFINGCAVSTTYTSHYNRPLVKESVKNEVEFTKPFPELWDELVKGLAKHFYVINNIEKASRIINVSFSSNSPRDYINCGTTTREFKQGKVIQRVVYNLAESSTFTIPGGVAGQYGEYTVLHWVYRTTSLEGKINIYVAPSLTKSSTQVSVNAKYIWRVAGTGSTTTQDWLGNIVQTQPLTPYSTLHSFNTNQANTTSIALEQGHVVQVSCQSTGKLENDIINLIIK